MYILLIPDFCREHLLKLGSDQSKSWGFDGVESIVQGGAIEPGRTSHEGNIPYDLTAVVKPFLMFASPLTMDLSKPRCYSQDLLLPSLATGKPRVRIFYSTFNKGTHPRTTHND